MSALNGEDRLVAALLTRLPATGRTEGVRIGAGEDDCAVVRPAGGNSWQLLKTDCVIEGVHFAPDAAPAQVGWKALCRPLSDIAATGGKPRYALVTMALNPQAALSWATGVYAGIARAAKEFAVARRRRDGGDPGTDLPVGLCDRHGETRPVRDPGRRPARRRALRHRQAGWFVAERSSPHVPSPIVGGPLAGQTLSHPRDDGPQRWTGRRLAAPGACQPRGFYYSGRTSTPCRRLHGRASLERWGRLRTPVRGGHGGTSEAGKSLEAAVSVASLDCHRLLGRRGNDVWHGRKRWLRPFSWRLPAGLKSPK